jgi:SnoaL-like polyketide cyclase
MTLQRIVAGDRLAAVEWRMAGNFTGAAFQGIDPTGKPLELRGLDLLEIEDGEIVSNAAYFDGMAFARQVGMMPAQDSGAERAMKGAFNAITKARRAIAERSGGPEGAGA